MDVESEDEPTLKSILVVIIMTLVLMGQRLVFDDNMKNILMTPASMAAEGGFIKGMTVI